MRLLILSCLLAFSVFGQNQLTKTYIETLCSPSFHGRGYVNGGDSIAAGFISKSFQEIGLKPFDENYFQEFHFPVQTFPGACELKVDGESLIPGVHFLVAPNSGPSCAEFDCKKGKSYRVVTCNVEKLYQSTSSFYPCPSNVILAVRSFGISPDSLKVIKTRIRELSAFAPVMDVTRDKFTWSVSQTANAYPFIQVQDSVFERMLEGSIELHIETRLLKDHVAKNVIGYVPAKKNAKRKPFLFLTAHYDHLGRMGQASYFPGANDNASGNGMLYSIAQQIAKQPLEKYNVVFIAFAGEEAGLIGSKYYVEHPLIPMKNIRFLLNLDIMGSGEEGITCVNSTLFKKEFDRLIQLNDVAHYLPVIKQRGPAANSDHYFFTAAGVPAFFIYTMGPNKNYHDVFDTFEALSFDKFDEIEHLLLEFIRGF
jgi:aminopeptidase YwaD